MQGHGHGHGEGHALAPRVYAAHAAREAHAAELPAARLLELREPPAANHVALLIGVIACGLVLALAGVALARARPRARRARAPAPRPAPAPDAEMAWDDSALTITVNPMDAGGPPRPGKARPDAAAPDSSGESCSDSDSDRHDSSDEDDEGNRGTPL